MTRPDDRPLDRPLPVPADMLPWTIHPALTEERLRAAAGAWEAGHGAAGLGRDGRRHLVDRLPRLQRAAERGTHDWLTVLDAGHHFVFLIEDVPVRFFRGSADEPTNRTLRRQVIEAQQFIMAPGGKADGLVFRLALDAGSGPRRRGRQRGVPGSARAEDGRVECFWPIPLDREAEVLRPEPTQLRLLGADASDMLASAAPGPKRPGAGHRKTSGFRRRDQS